MANLYIMSSNPFVKSQPQLSGQRPVNVSNLRNIKAQPIKSAMEVIPIKKFVDLVPIPEKGNLGLYLIGGAVAFAVFNSMGGR